MVAQIRALSMFNCTSRPSALGLLLLAALSSVVVSTPEQRDETATILLSQFSGLDMWMLDQFVARAVPPDALRGLKRGSKGKKKKKKKKDRKKKKGSETKSRSEGKSTSSSVLGGSTSLDTCNPEDVVLSEFQQWRDETGFWIGNYDFYNSDGEHVTSPLWPFSYKKYRGFITGNVDGNMYRQRNVFIYPPLPPMECADANQDVINMFDGTCGENGNTKVFFADQEATTCSSNPVEQGDIEGPYQDYFYTKTELIGRENAVLYQVFLEAGAFPAGYFGPESPAYPAEDCLFQSQLTTITRSLDGQAYRTRTAQNFECFDPTNYGQPIEVSYYREHKVEETEFYDELEKSLDEFGVTTADTCAWMNDDVAKPIPSPYVANPGPGVDACRVHLEQSFEAL